MGAAEPKTDRELLLQLNGNVRNLADSIEKFSESLEKIEVEKIQALDKRIGSLEKVWLQISGAWRFVLVMWSILTATGLIGLLKWFWIK